MDSFNSSLTSAIRARIQEGMLHNELAMRMTAEKRAAEYLALVLEIVEAIAPGILEKYHDQYIENWQPEAWRAALPEILIQAESRLGNQTDLVRSLKVQIRDIQQKNEKLTQALIDSQTEMDHLRRSVVRGTKPIQEQAEQVTRPASQLSFLPRTSRSAPAKFTAALPPVEILLPDESAIPRGWDFADRLDFQRKATLVGLIGKTGRCSRPAIGEELGRHLGMKSGRSGTVIRTIEICQRLGWIELLQSSERWEGGLPHLIRLTSQGEALYRALFGEEPVISELTHLLEQHAPNGEEHAILCIAAAEQFERLGARVDLLPPVIILDGHKYQPDLKVTVSDESDRERVWLVECERANGMAEGRRAKWDNAITTQGVVYVVTPDARVRDLLVDEVLALGRRSRVYASDIQSLRYASITNPWAIVKEANQNILLPD